MKHTWKATKAAGISLLLAALLFTGCGYATSALQSKSESAPQPEETGSSSVVSGATAQPGNLSEHTRDAIVQRGKLIAALVQNNVPFCFPDNKGQQIGLDTAVANTMAEDLGVEAEYLLFDSAKEALDAVYTGAADLALGGFGAQEESADRAAFSNCYSGGAQCLLMRAEDVERYPTVDTLFGKVVAILRGNEAQKAAAAELLPDCQIVERSTTDKCISRLRGGECVAVMLDTFLCDAYASDCIDLARSPLELVPEQQPAGAQIAVMRENETLLAYLNEEIELYTKTSGWGRLMISAQEKAANLGLLS